MFYNCTSSGKCRQESGYKKNSHKTGLRVLAVGKEKVFIVWSWDVTGGLHAHKMLASSYHKSLRTKRVPTSIKQIKKVNSRKALKNSLSTFIPILQPYPTRSWDSPNIERQIHRHTRTFNQKNLNKAETRSYGKHMKFYKVKYGYGIVCVCGYTLEDSCGWKRSERMWWQKIYFQDEVRWSWMLFKDISFLIKWWHMATLLFPANWTRKNRKKNP